MFITITVQREKLTILGKISVVRDIFHMGIEAQKEFKFQESAQFNINILLELFFVSSSMGERVWRQIPFSLGKFCC